MGKFIVSTRSNGEFQFKLVAGNGQTILSSEGYSTKPACMNGVESVKKNSQDDKRFDKKDSTSGKFYFNLTATNGQIIGTSQMYAAEDGRSGGIDSVKTNAADATVEDETSK